MSLVSRLGLAITLWVIVMLLMVIALTLVNPDKAVGNATAATVVSLLGSFGGAIGVVLIFGQKD